MPAISGPAIPEAVRRSRLLVDGYNLLFGQGWASRQQASHGALQRGRELLAERLAARVPSNRRPLVWIVFDALDAPRHLPGAVRMRDMEVVFSRDWVSADEMLQQILGIHPSPKSLVVISSDHAVQRKAIARGARVYDNDRWEEAVDAAFVVSDPPAQTPNPTEAGKDRFVTDAERDEWMKRFGF